MRAISYEVVWDWTEQAGSRAAGDIRIVDYKTSKAPREA
jgi:hypothetical protein